LEVQRERVGGLKMDGDDQERSVKVRYAILLFLY